MEAERRKARMASGDGDVKSILCFGMLYMFGFEIVAVVVLQVQVMMSKVPTHGRSSEVMLLFSS